MIYIKSKSEIDRLRKGGKILARILDQVIKAVEPGISTYSLNLLAEKLIRKYQAKPSFKGYQGFPASLCASVNDQVVHTIPNAETLLKSGDIISLDLGIWYEGLCTDIARTVGVGKITTEAEHLIAITQESLKNGIAMIKPGNRIGDISSAIQAWVEAQGYSVVRTLFGHGVGRDVHEEPRIPNFGKPKTGEILKPGMVIAIEPMVIIGRHEVITDRDGWTIKTADGSLSAHFEDTVAVTKRGYEVLTKE